MHSCMVFIEIQSNLRRKKLHRTNQGSNFLGGSFNNRDNVRAPVQFRRESQPQHLKRWFFLKNRPIHFHINSTSVIRPVKRNQLSFSSIEINKPLPAPVQCLIDQIQVQKPILETSTFSFTLPHKTSFWHILTQPPTSINIKCWTHKFIPLSWSGGKILEQLLDFKIQIETNKQTKKAKQQ